MKDTFFRQTTHILIIYIKSSDRPWDNFKSQSKTFANQKYIDI